MSRPVSPSASVEDVEKKVDVTHAEHVAPELHASGSGSHGAKDAALEVLGPEATPMHISPEEDRAVLRKIDLWLMPIIVMVYFLQQLDKSSLSYASVFGIVNDAHLVGQQYSWLGSIVYVAQMIWQPVSSYLLVKMPVAKWLFFNVLMWGVVVSCTAAANDFSKLLATRFFLGIFEATVAPCFITITQMWWRRREQTLRLAIWFAANGATGMVGSLISWGIGHINGKLFPYQSIFLFIGLLTVVLSPLVWLILPDSPVKARFLSHEEKVIAVERLRANNMGTETKVWKWDQVWDLALDIKTYLWFALLFLCALPSGGISNFGPLIIKGFGFNQFETLLFNIPFSALQVILTILAAIASTKMKLKWPVAFFLCLPPIAGSSALLVLGRGPELRNKLLGCYYVLSFFSTIQPMLYTWSSQNTAGHTKKLCTTGVVFVAQCVGNIVGPLLYTTEEAPYYRRGLIADLVCWIALSIMILFTAAYLAFLNKQHAALRKRMGKAAEIIDTSLETTERSAQLQKANEEKELAEGSDPAVLNNRAFDDLTDRQNEDFIYVL
ncbi:MFS general substrate transporter [Phanerochaete sordida]|uniref:MFS general substrate transporter n=1 Tax=Phanerochaete sordida TaxID=48140 RepID=A0A9P3LEZ9_9APHY|nr:MFS general substrate transporter [Phanerochaete sordida]